MNKLPSSPAEMPSELFNNANWLRNTLVTLGRFRSVGIYWEQDVPMTNGTGEAMGYWEVVISAAGEQFRGKSENIQSALWYASECADAARAEMWQRRESDRKKALAKLTEEERKLLGV